MTPGNWALNYFFFRARRHLLFNVNFSSHFPFTCLELMRKISCNSAFMFNRFPDRNDSAFSHNFTPQFHVSFTQQNSDWKSFTIYYNKEVIGKVV